MNRIATIKLDAFKSVFAGYNQYKDRYTQIQNILNKTPYADLFALPKYLDNKNIIRWSTPLEGTVQSFEDIDEQQQQQILNQVRLDLDSIIDIFSERYIAQGQKITRHDIEKWFEIPSTSFIHLVTKTNGEEQPILTMWGCVEDSINATRGILMSIKAKKSHHIKVQLICDNQAIVTGGVKVKYVKEGGEQIIKTTNPKGAAELGKAFEGEQFSIVVEQYDVIESFICDGRDLYQVTLSPKNKVTIQTQSKGGIPISAIPIQIQIKDKDGQVEKELNGKTDENGKYYLEEDILGKTIETQYNRKETWSEPQIDIINDDGQVVLLEIDISYKVRFLDAKNKEIPLLPIVSDLPIEANTFTTNEAGEIALEEVINGQKIKFTTTYKEKKYTNTITINEAEEVYNIVLKPNRWWLLLWLLPLLLLLIPVEETLEVEVLSTVGDLPIEATNLRLEYYIEADSVKLQDTLTDSLGVACLSFGQTFLFHRLFCSYPQGQLYITKGCFVDTAVDIRTFSKLWTNTVKLAPTTLATLDFVVKNINTGHPISNAQVGIKAYYNGIEVMKQTEVTSFGGTITIENVPQCAKIFAKAIKPFHEPDSIGWVQVDSIAEQLAYRTLELNSLLEDQIFFVKSTTNQNGLPGALIEAHVELGNDVLDTIKTVVAPDGKITIPIPDSGTVFMQGTLLGYYDSTYFSKVINIKEASSDKDLTLWMRPKTYQLDFTVLDTVTQQPIPNAVVTLSCDQAQTSSGNTNTAGVTYLGGARIDCSVKVEASHPNYLTKQKLGDYTYFKANDTNRIIYLRPKPPTGPEPSDCVDHSKVTKRKPLDEAVYFMGKQKGKFKFRYDTNGAPDKIEIFCKGKLIWSYDAASGSSKEAYIDFNDPYIKVKVTGTTYWDYTVYCPDN